MSTAEAPEESVPPETTPNGESPAPAADASPLSAADSSRATVWGLASLFGLYYFIQGIGEPGDGLLSQPLRSMLDSWGQSTGQIGEFMGVLGLPWTFKPLFGMLSDFVPLAGSRRKSYLVLMSAFCVIAFLLLWWFPVEAGSVAPLLALLSVAAIGISFSDVVVDALMVEKGQPLGLTGHFQAIQWGCIWAAAVLSGTVGGYLTEHKQIGVGYLICGAASLAAILLTLACVREKRQSVDRKQLVGTLRQLWIAARSPAVLAVGIFLFLWNFNPFSTTVLQLHMTKVMHFGDQFYGNFQSVNAAGAMLGSISYALYCRRVSRPILIHLSIALGVVATLAFWAMEGETSAMLVSFGTGVATGSAFVIQLDLAAQACPALTAGTVFALLMSLANLGTSLSTMLGGRWYDAWSATWDKQTAFMLLVGVGAAFTAGCWLLVPFLRHSLPPSRNENEYDA